MYWGLAQAVNITDILGFIETQTAGGIDSGFGAG
jgi:hypothetical protein